MPGLRVELASVELEDVKLEVDNDSDNSTEEEDTPKVEDSIAVGVEEIITDTEEDFTPAQNPLEQVLKAHCVSKVQEAWKFP